MDRSDIVKLIKCTYTSDSIGNKVATETAKEVFVNLRSISGAEWFNAAQANIKPQYEVVMFRYDYDDEKVVEYGGHRYGVYRTYAGKNDKLSLYLEDKVGV